LSGTDSSWFAWATAGVATVIATLAGVVAKLFQMRESETSKSIAELKQEVAITKASAHKCEEDRTTLFAQCEVMKYKIDNLETRISSIDRDGTKFSHTLDGQRGNA
jgi:hypothetical protein